MIASSASSSTRLDVELLRDRVRLYLKVLFLIDAAFSLVLSIQFAVEAGPPVGTALPVSPEVTLWTVTAAVGFAWLYVVRCVPSRSILHALETLGTVLLSTTYIHIVVKFDVPEGRTIGLLLVSLALVLRASLVPSAIGRTVVVGLLGVAGAVAGSVVVGAPGGATQHVWLAVLGAAFVGITGVTSAVIYGLRREVHAAQRLGQYELGRKLGEGAMGVVHEATHMLLRRPTAIKLLPVSKAGELTVERFEREVRETSRLEHPNSVYIYDYGRTPDGQFYYAMEFLDGLNLRELVDQEGSLPQGRVRDILLQAARALAEAHGKGLVHRDIKPANVMLCSRGGVPDTVKVLDFGLVKAVGTGETDRTMTQANMIEGTPQYLAPEAIKNAETVGPPADVYALGAVAFFLLTGREVFPAESIIEVCSRHLNETPERPSTLRSEPLDSRFEALILRCLEKDPAARFPDGQQLGDALEALVIHGWDPSDARQWWREHRPSRRQPDAPGAVARTQLEVDVDAR